MELVYMVSEKDQYKNMTIEYFGDRREDALKYFKTKYAILSKELKDWELETGVYLYIWRKGEEYRELKFETKEVT